MFNIMGVLSDIIIADRAEAASINAAVGRHFEQWDTLASKGIDTVKLGKLSQILASRSLDDAETIARFMAHDVLHEASDDGPWIFPLPDELVSAVAALDDKTEKSVAAKWSAIEEFRLDHWKPAVVEEYLHDLVVHARKARDAGKSLLLWICL